MCVLHSICYAPLPTTPVRLHAPAPPKLFANQIRPLSAQGFQHSPTVPATFKRKPDRHRHNRRLEHAAFTCTCQCRHSTPQASTADASAERRPKVVGLGLACWDFLAQVAAFPKPDEKLRTQKMEVFHAGAAHASPGWPCTW